MSSVSGNTHKDRKYSHTETEKTTLYSGESIHAKNHRKISEDIPHHELKYKTEVLSRLNAGVPVLGNRREVPLRQKGNIFRDDSVSMPMGKWK